MRFQVLTAARFAAGMIAFLLSPPTAAQVFHVGEAGRMARFTAPALPPVSAHATGRSAAALVQLFGKSARVSGFVMPPCDDAPGCIQLAALAAE